MYNEERDEEKKNREILAEKVLKAKGSNKEKEELIKEYTPLINKKASQFKRQYFSLDYDDIKSVVLESFLESIKKYKKENGAFLGFFYTVSSSRIIDFYRKEIKYQSKIETKFKETDGQESDDYEAKNIKKTKEKEKYSEQERSKDILKELYTLEKSLEFMGISLKDVAKAAPKQKESYSKAYDLIEKILSEEELANDILNNKNFDLELISQKTHVEKPFVKKTEFFVIALMMIKDLGLTLLDKYII